MTNTYDTSNEPLGSTAVKVLYNNASNLDDASNSDADTWVDRPPFGRVRRTWRGMENAFDAFLQGTAFELPPLVYVDGSPLVVARATQLIQRTGLLYGVKLPQTFPYTLTGTWATDEPNLTVRNDQSLKQFLATSAGAGSIGKTGGGTLQDTATVVDSSTASDALGHEQLGTFVGSKIGRALRQNLFERYGSINDINSFRVNEGTIKGRKINILSDSIGFGAGAGNIYYDAIPENSWVRILGNALNAKYGLNSYGFVSPYDTNGTGREIHTVQTTGTWVEGFAAGAAHTPAGYYRGSTAANATLAFAMGAIQSSHFKIWYDGSVTGSFEIALNGGAIVLDTITTTGAGVGLEVSATYACTPLVAGNISHRIRVISGEVRITGISYLNESTGLEYQLNNFARDGREGKLVTENVIKEACRGTLALVWALAANDRTAVGAAFTAYQQRIDWLIQYCNLYGTKLIVPDFLFINADNNPIRQELRRLVANVPNATYIPFPNMVSSDGTVQSAAYLDSTVHFTYDSVHPDRLGHRIIAQAIGEALGVDADKMSNLTDNGRWRGLPLTAASNSTLTFEGVSRFRFSAHKVDLWLSIGSVASGTLVATIPGLPGRLVAAQYKSLPDASGRTALVLIGVTGAITVFSDAASPSAPTQVSLSVSVPFVTQAGFV